MVSQKRREAVTLLGSVTGDDAAAALHVKCAVAVDDCADDVCSSVEGGGERYAGLVCPGPVGAKVGSHGFRRGDADRSW